MPASTLKQFLDRNKIRYVTVRHSVAYTTQEVAESAHIPGRIMAKTVILEIDGALAMAVLPSFQRIQIEE